MQTKVVGVTFSIYADEHDGAPLWSEIQNLQLDKDGNYTALLGMTRAEGIPVDLFSSNQPRWLEVEIDQVKQPRILLGSVPYALKASDADTLGGLPASAYLRVNAAPAAGATPESVAASAGSRPNVALTGSLLPLINSGAPGCIGLFSNNSDLICSAMSQSIFQGNPAVSIGAPTAYLGALTMVGNVPNSDAAGMALYNAGAGAGASVSLDMYNTPANGGIPQAKMKAIDDGNYSDHLTFWTKIPGSGSNPVTEKVRITSTGNVGIGTSNPAAKLEVNGNLMVNGNINLSGAVQSGSGAIFQSSSSTNNVALGPQSLTSAGGTNNTALGSGTLTSNVGANNTAIGSQALAGDTTGNSNVAVGAGAAQMANPVNSVAVGALALANNTNGIGNTAVGWSALNSLSSGSQNIALGFGAGQFMQTGAGNVAVGFGAAQNLASGTNNIVIGNLAGQSLTSGFNNIYIGADLPAGSNQEHGAIRIGNVGTATSTWIGGIFGVTNTGSLPVLINNQGQLFTTQSSRRYKEDIRDMGDASAALMRLRPVTFRYKKAFSDGSKPMQYGLIAEEVAEVYPDLVVRAADGQVESVQYHILPAMLLNEVQRLNAKNKAQEEKIHSLEERLARVESLLERTTSTAALPK